MEFGGAWTEDLLRGYSTIQKYTRTASAILTEVAEGHQTLEYLAKF